MESLKRAAIKHFNSFTLSLPWDFDDSLEENNKISLTVLDLSAQRLNSEEHLISFTIRIVVTLSKEGLYDLETISGEPSSLLLDPIVLDDVCATPLKEFIKVEVFDFKHSHKQSLMEQVYTSRLRG